MEIKLTEYSHGAGCGCKLSPGVLANILEGQTAGPVFKNLLVGNNTSDDAAVIALDDKTAIVSTTDFFMPIVDDPYDFGAIAATNSISDIYAMGAEPIMAIAILGWPIDKIPAEVAGTVLKGAREKCLEAGIPLAGGHSIDAPEPIFGLAVTGKAPIEQIKKNSEAQQGDILFLTKPLGIGITTTAQKQKKVKEEDLMEAKKVMLTLNKAGHRAAQYDFVHAITDVTGFGLAGHLLEICNASELSANIYSDKIPVFPFVNSYLEQGCVPGGTHRNLSTYGDRLSTSNDRDRFIVADPQTSGGLLMAVDPLHAGAFEKILTEQSQDYWIIGELFAPDRTHSVNVL